MSNKTILFSPVQALNHLVLNSIPAKPLADMRIVRVPNSNVVVAVDAKGKVYSSQVDTGVTRQYCDFTVGRIRHTVAGLVLLKAISKAAVDDHKQRLERETRKDKLHGEAASFIEALGVLGLAPTRSQLKTLDAVMKPSVVRAKLVEAGVLIPEPTATATTKFVQQSINAAAKAVSRKRK